MKANKNNMNATKQTAEEAYTLTFKGLIHLQMISDLPENPEQATNKILDGIELYLRRHYSKDGCPAIILNLETGKFEFATVQQK